MPVEFLPGDEPVADGAGESLSEPRRRRWWLLATAFFAAGVVAYAVTRPAGQPAAPRPSASTSTSPHVIAVAPECRRVPDCSVRLGVRGPLAREVRSYLPDGAQLHIRTVIEVDSLTHRDLLVARDVDAQLGSVTVRIRVQRGGPQRRSIVPDPLGVGSLLLHRINSGFVVRLQYLAPDDVPPDVTRLLALMSDPRLAAS